MRYDDVKELISIFEKTDLNDMELSLDNLSLRLSRGTSQAVQTQPVQAVQAVQTQPVQQPVAAPETPAAAEAEAAGGEEEKEGTLVKAPIVGTFYASAAPDKPPYVKAGDTVAEGDTLCIIEAMKFMNEVPSEVSGTVAEVLVKDGEFVEYGQPLFRIV